MSMYAYDVDADNLAIRLFDLPQRSEVIPEARLCDNLVRCEDAHAVQFW